MSKYIYATVYEQFTGLKPPEPKSHKPRRRRGYGHPYRMRLNMQENEHEEREEDNSRPGDALDSVTTRDHKFEQPRFNDNLEMNPGNTDRSLKPRSDKIRNRTYNRSSKTLLSANTAPRAPVEEKVARAPKVTYKKRRHFLNEAEATS